MTGPAAGRGTGLPGAARATGFTLLELMVVMILIGIIFSFAVLSMRGDDVAELMEREVRRLESLLMLASDEAIVRGEEYGVRFVDDGYEFLVLALEGWQLPEDGLLRSYTLPADIRVRLTLEEDRPSGRDEPDDPDAEPPPQVLILSSGEMTPFTASFDSELSDYRYRLTTTLLGEVEHEREGPL